VSGGRLERGWGLALRGVPRGSATTGPVGTTAGRRDGSTASGRDHRAATRAPRRDENPKLMREHRAGARASLSEWHGVTGSVRRSWHVAPNEEHRSRGQRAPHRSRISALATAQRHLAGTSLSVEHRTDLRAPLTNSTESVTRPEHRSRSGAVGATRARRGRVRCTWLPPARRPGEESQVDSPIERRSPHRTARRLRAGKLGSAVTLQSTALFTGRRSLGEGRLEAEVRSESRSESTVLKGGRCSQSYGERTGGEGAALIAERCSRAARGVRTESTALALTAPAPHARPPLTTPGPPHSGPRHSGPSDSRTDDSGTDDSGTAPATPGPLR
jgi:hypothetical protein